MVDRPWDVAGYNVRLVDAINDQKWQGAETIRFAIKMLILEKFLNDDVGEEVTYARFVLWNAYNHVKFSNGDRSDTKTALMHHLLADAEMAALVINFST